MGQFLVLFSGPMWPEVIVLHYSGMNIGSDDAADWARDGVPVLVSACGEVFISKKWLTYQQDANVSSKIFKYLVPQKKNYHFSWICVVSSVLCRFSLVTIFAWTTAEGGLAKRFCFTRISQVDARFLFIVLCIELGGIIFEIFPSAKLTGNPHHPCSCDYCASTKQLHKPGVQVSAPDPTSTCFAECDVILKLCGLLSHTPLHTLLLRPWFLGAI